MKKMNISEKTSENRIDEVFERVEKVEKNVEDIKRMVQASYDMLVALSKINGLKAVKVENGSEKGLNESSGSGYYWEE